MKFLCISAAPIVSEDGVACPGGAMFGRNLATGQLERVTIQARFW